MLLSRYQNWNLNRNSQYQTAWTYSGSEAVTCCQGRWIHMHAKTGTFLQLFVVNISDSTEETNGHKIEVVDIQELILSFVPVT